MIRENVNKIMEALKLTEFRFHDNKGLMRKPWTDYHYRVFIYYPDKEYIDYVVSSGENLAGVRCTRVDVDAGMLNCIFDELLEVCKRHFKYEIEEDKKQQEKQNVVNFLMQRGII